MDGRGTPASNRVADNHATDRKPTCRCTHAQRTRHHRATAGTVTGSVAPAPQCCHQSGVVSITYSTRSGTIAQAIISSDGERRLPGDAQSNHSRISRTNQRPRSSILGGGPAETGEESSRAIKKSPPVQAGGVATSYFPRGLPPKYREG